jgi:hypothetical protein
MAKRWLWALAIVAGAAPLACSSSNGNGNDGGTDASSMKACTDLANAVCNELQQCTPALVTGVWGSTAACASANESTCAASLALTNTSDTPSTAEACSAAYGSLSCAAAFDNNPPTACIRQTPGPLALGSPCGTPGQCASSVCQVDSVTGCGQCIAAVAAGAACKATSDCQTGLVCAATSATAAVCVAPAATSAACSTKYPIIPCDYDLVCNAGVCQAPLAAGSACNPAASLCDATNGYWCTPYDTRCVLVLFAGTGQACGYDKATGDLTNCSGSGACQNVSMTTGLGTCTAPVASGSMCNVVTGPFCIPPAGCMTVPDAGADAGAMGMCTTFNPAMCN